MADLIEVVEAHAAKDFESRPVYHEDGDFLTLFTRDCDCHSERVDETVTVYRDDESNEIVGIKIKGVLGLLQHVGPKGVILESEECQLGVIFASVALSGRLDEQQIKVLRYLQGHFGKITATIGTLSESQVHSNEANAF